MLGLSKIHKYNELELELILTLINSISIKLYKQELKCLF